MGALAPFDASAYDSAIRVNGAEPRMLDVDLDGCADLVMAWTTAPLRTESPLVYRNNGSDRVEAISPEPFAGADRRPAARPKRWDREYLRHQRIASPAVARHQLLSLD